MFLNGDGIYFYLSLFLFILLYFVSKRTAKCFGICSIFIAVFAMHSGKEETSKHFTYPSTLNMAFSCHPYMFSHVCNRLHIHTWINCAATMLKWLTPTLTSADGPQTKEGILHF